MKRIDKLQVFNPKTMHGKCNLQYDKSGLKIINKSPNEWNLNSFGNKLCNKNGIQQIVIKSLCNHHVGSLIKLATDYLVTIENIQLKRLTDISENQAKKAGIESGIEYENGLFFKHYCPEQFFSEAEIKDLSEETIGYKSALGSFYSLWIKKHGMNDVFENPWIWQYTFKYNKAKSKKK
jgi:hypothetical protein